MPLFYDCSSTHKQPACRSLTLTCRLRAHSALQNSVAFPIGCKQGRNVCVILGPASPSKSTSNALRTSSHTSHTFNWQRHTSCHTPLLVSHANASYTPHTPQLPSGRPLRIAELTCIPHGTVSEGRNVFVIPRRHIGKPHSTQGLIH